MPVLILTKSIKTQVFLSFLRSISNKSYVGYNRAKLSERNCQRQHTDEPDSQKKPVDISRPRGSNEKQFNHSRAHEQQALSANSVASALRIQIGLKMSAIWTKCVESQPRPLSETTDPSAARGVLASFVSTRKKKQKKLEDAKTDTLYRSADPHHHRCTYVHDKKPIVRITFIVTDRRVATTGLHLLLINSFGSASLPVRVPHSTKFCYNYIVCLQKFIPVVEIPVELQY